MSCLGLNDMMGKAKLPNSSSRRSRKSEHKTERKIKMLSFIGLYRQELNSVPNRSSPGNQKTPNRLIKVFPSRGENPRMTSGHLFSARNLT